MADTLAGRLKRMKWRFAEARMQKEWNELWAFADSTMNALPSLNALNGTLDYAANIGVVSAAASPAMGGGGATLIPQGNVEDSGDTSDASNVHRRVDLGNSGYQTRNTPRGGFIA